MVNFALIPAFWLLLALVPIGIFYFLRMRFRRQPMGSVYLWRSLLREADTGQRLQRKSVLLLILQILAATCLVIAIASPFIVNSSVRKPGVIYVIDASASMGAKQTETRFATAIKALGADLRTLPSDTPVAVFLGSLSAEPLDRADMSMRHAGDADAIISALAGTQPSLASFDEEQVAANLASWLHMDGGNWSIVYIGDGGVSLGGTRLAQLVDGRLRALRVDQSDAGDFGNIGLSALRISGDQAQFTILNSFASAQEIDLELVCRPVGSDQFNQPIVAHFTVEPGTTQKTMPVPSLTNGLWTIRLVKNSDALAADDTCSLVVSAPRRVRVLHLGPENPFVRAVFASELVDYRTQETAAGIVAGAQDVVVSDLTLLPMDIPANLLSFGAIPPGAPLTLGAEITGQLQNMASDHPLARALEWNEVHANSARILVLQAGVDALAQIGSSTVAAAWERNGYRNCIISINLLDSTLGMSGVFPVLVRNMVSWVLPQAGNPLADTFRVGEQRQRAVSPDWSVDVAGMESVRTGGGQVKLRAIKAGVWNWHDGAQSGFFVVNLSPAESDLTPRALPAATTIQRTPNGSAPVSSTPHVERIGLVLVPALCVLLLLAAEWFLWHGRGRPGGRGRVLLVLRVGAFTAVILALVGAAIPLPSTQRVAVLAFDQSDSVGAQRMTQMRAEALRLVGQMKPEDRVALMSFAGTPRLIAGFATPAETMQLLSLAETGAAVPGETNMAEALDLASSLIKGMQGNHEVFIWTDGRPTVGGTLADLRNAYPGMTINCIPVAVDRGVVSTGTIAIPETVHPGEEIKLGWQIQSTKEISAVLSLSRDGVSEAPRTVLIKAGVSTLDIPVHAGQSGSTRVLVGLRLPDGSPLVGAEAGGVIRVGPAARVLIINGESGQTPLAAALRTQGMQVVEGDSGILPDNDEAWADISAVVLDSVPALLLSGAQQDTLVRWVAGGGGLLVVGGTQGLGRGEYSVTALEDMLPVNTDTRRRLYFTRSRILFVVDHSGSMTEDTGNMTKLEAAMNGVAQSVAQLNAADEVGVLTFDSEATWLLPFTAVSKQNTIKTALGQISEGGGTDMASALEEVVATFGEPGPIRRHVVILTDGQTSRSNANFREMAARLHNAGVTVSTIGVGETIDEQLLRNLATWGGGQFWRAVGDDIPQIMTKETVRITRDLIQEGRFMPQVRTVGGAISGMETQFLPVQGYQITRAKPGAQVILDIEGRAEAGAADGAARSGPVRDPLLASWHFGSGQVAVFAADSGRRWLSAWSGTSLYPRFWSQVLRSIERGGRDHGLQAQVRVGASTATVAVDAAGDDGHLLAGLELVGRHNGQSFNLTETAPGHYEARIPLDATGLARFEIADRSSGTWTDAWAWNPPGAEQRGDGTDLTGLGRLVSASGGMLLPSVALNLPPARVSLVGLALAPWLLLAALLLLLVELGLRSTALGQISMARALFADWWQRQVARSRADYSSESVDNLADKQAVHRAEERRTQDAWRYLAQRVRLRDEAKQRAEAALAQTNQKKPEGED